MMSMRIIYHSPKKNPIFYLNMCKQAMNSKRHIIPFLFGYKWGYKDKEGNVVVEPMWDSSMIPTIVRNAKRLQSFLCTTDYKELM